MSSSLLSSVNQINYTSNSLNKCKECANIEIANADYTISFDAHLISHNLIIVCFIFVVCHFNEQRLDFNVLNYNWFIFLFEMQMAKNWTRNSTFRMEFQCRIEHNAIDDN